MLRTITTAFNCIFVSPNQLCNVEGICIEFAVLTVWKVPGILKICNVFDKVL